MNPAGDAFAVSWLSACRESVAALVSWAIERNTLEPLARFLVEIEVELRTRPREWGDPVWNRPGLQLVEYARVNFPDRLQVSYLGP